jgi:hypothetical protein
VRLMTVVYCRVVLDHDSMNVMIVMYCRRRQGGPPDAQAYFRPSMLENPWKDLESKLEAQLRQKRGESAKRAPLSPQPTSGRSLADAFDDPSEVLSCLKARRENAQ